MKGKPETVVPEAAAAEALRSAIAQFGAGAEDRTQLTDNELARVKGFTKLADAFATASAAAWYPAEERRGLGMPSRESRPAYRIVVAVQQLAKLTTEVESRSVAGVAIDSPAIAHQPVRQAVAQLCNQIVADIDHALEKAAVRDESRAANRQEMFETFEYYRAWPASAGIVAAILELSDESRYTGVMGDSSKIRIGAGAREGLSSAFRDLVVADRERPRAKGEPPHRGGLGESVWRVAEKWLAANATTVKAA